MVGGILITFAMKDGMVGEFNNRAICEEYGVVVGGFNSRVICEEYSWWILQQGYL